MTLGMAEAALPRQSRAGIALPRIVFVLGKGGVGRSTVATALGLVCASRGEQTLVLQWALADAIGPWFGVAPAEAAPREIAPRLRVANFSLDEALRAYFVDHLHLGLVYRRIIRARPVARLLEVAPGLAEMFFLGQLWWLTTLAEREAQIRVDRIIVDAPATGHGASLLDVPATLTGMSLGGLLELETGRVIDMMADPARTGAILVSQPEPMVIEETVELVPRIARRLGRPPLALVVNASAAAITGAEDDPAWLAGCAPPLSPHARGAVIAAHRELRARAALEGELRDRVAAPSWSIPDLPGLAPVEVARAAAHVLEAI